MYSWEQNSWDTPDRSGTEPFVSNGRVHKVRCKLRRGFETHTRPTVWTGKNRYSFIQASKRTNPLSRNTGLSTVEALRPVFEARTKTSFSTDRARNSFDHSLKRVPNPLSRWESSIQLRLVSEARTKPSDSMDELGTAPIRL